MKAQIVDGDLITERNLGKKLPVPAVGATSGPDGDLDFSRPGINANHLKLTPDENATIIQATRKAFGHK